MTNLRIVGRLRLDTYFGANGELHEQMLGGGLIYAAVGARVWLDHVQACCLVSREFSRARLRTLQDRGIDFELFNPEHEDPEHHLFFAYEPSHLRAANPPASRYLRANRQIPKELLRAATSPVERLDLGRLQSIGGLASDDVVLFSGSGWKSTLFHLQDCQRLAAYTVFDPDSLDFRSANREPLSQLLPMVECLIVSERQAQRYFRPLALPAEVMGRKLRERGPRLVVIKRGAQGATLIDRDQTAWDVPAYPATVVDVTGAGHAFNGGFAAALASGLSDIDAVCWGTVSASLVIEGAGPEYALNAHPNLANARLDSVKPGRRRSV